MTGDTTTSYGPQGFIVITTTSGDTATSTGLVSIRRAWGDATADLARVVSEFERRCAQLLAWTRWAVADALRLLRSHRERRQPVRVAAPRGRTCSLAEAWRVRGPP